MNQEVENMLVCDTPPRTFVEPDEYRRLMISNRHLVRRDDRAAGLRGLWDINSGAWFVIEEEELYASQFSGREPQTLGA